jgi:hypothetical protein
MSCWPGPYMLRCCLGCRSVLQDEHEGAAKKGLAVMTEMWRRHVWRDARTVNVIGGGPPEGGWGRGWGWVPGVWGPRSVPQRQRRPEAASSCGGCRGVWLGYRRGCSVKRLPGLISRVGACRTCAAQCACIYWLRPAPQRHA